MHARHKNLTRIFKQNSGQSRGLSYISILYIYYIYDMLFDMWYSLVIKEAALSINVDRLEALGRR